jgi:hypothetical protein
MKSKRWIWSSSGFDSRGPKVTTTATSFGNYPNCRSTKKFESGPRLRSHRADQCIRASQYKSEEKGKTKMSTNTKSNPWAADKNFEPYDANVHSKDLELNDVFNVMTNDAPPGGLRQKLAELVATNADAQQAVLESGGSLPTVAKNFHLSSGETGVIVCDTKGLWRATISVAGEPLSFTSESRDEAMLSAERYVQRSRGPRDLTPEEQLRVKRLALAGESASACQLYCELRLSNMKHRSEQDILNDPGLVGVLNDGSRFIFACTRLDYIPCAEFDELLDRVSASKPLNLNTIDWLFDRFQDNQAAAARAPRQAAPQAAATPERERQPAASPEQVQASLETLTDEQVEKLRAQSLRHRADLVRRFNARMGAR